MELKSVWRIQHFDVGQARPLEVASPGLDDRFWITARVPGDVHSALIERNIIENPYFGHNDAKSRWIEQKEWWYRTQFDYAKEEGGEEKHELTFEGLDTFATVYVNGLEIGTTDNMLMAHTFDVSRVLVNGRNTIAVKFDPLYLHNRDKQQFQWSSYTKERPWLRKAAMNFGWDWGPRMVTVGIWGKVCIERKRWARLNSVFARTVQASENNAIVRVDFDVTAYRRDHSRECEIRLRDAEGKTVASSKVPVPGTKGIVDLAVEQPQLWWTHDLGTPYLYELEVALLSNGETVDEYRTALGIRTIELKLKDEQGRNAFVFLLNGVKLFAKGANWIPADHFIGAIPDERYRDLISLSVDGNMNMLRVWAGGIYEKDVFYDECDRRGVLVWQDFAFANALFPDFNRNFMDNVRKEVEYAVKRLRNRTSLAIWCGNNEIDWLYDMKTSGGDLTCPFYGERIYHELIPDVLEELDNSRAYWPSSPFGGNDANDPDEGDRHNWQVWHGSVYPRKSGEAPLLDYSIQGVTFKNYKKDFTLFSSEFGMHASANRYTLEKNIPEGQFYWGSVEMAYRNKDTNHQKGILLMEGYTGIPGNIEEYMNFSMLTQAEGLKYGIEHYRRNKHRTSGSLIWQLNDSWPGTSWSLIDYELLPKASFYYAKKFYDPMLLSLDHEPGQDLQVWVVSDRLEACKGKVTLSVYDFGGALVSTHSFDASVPVNQAVRIGSLTEAEALNDHAPEEVVVKLTAEGFAAPANVFYLRDPKDLRMPAADLRMEASEAEQTVTVTAGRTIARMVKIDLPQGNIRFSDNYFDLLPGEQATVRISHPDGTKVPFEGLRVSALNSN
ncbi:glycoside hydrolase family 2 protein [Paenibacillus allorhizosphaerae]|uniref:Beta-mannosidase B n=1 Tax=Paenibacillus allorhizosphaerae TaxID=2849866 RepID=A0ABM8VS47_9BACL|nr:glycoside hydrolase family 2 protein [Paenibacillus allorhizosphaerae]CAG7655876.1 Exo-beta-D-glucosaminidase [Paenibacillus allorhizosphaerae]